MQINGEDRTTESTKDNFVAAELQRIAQDADLVEAYLVQIQEIDALEAHLSARLEVAQGLASARGEEELRKLLTQIKPLRASIEARTLGRMSSRGAAVAPPVPIEQPSRPETPTDPAPSPCAYAEEAPANAPLASTSVSWPSEERQVPDSRSKDELQQRSNELSEQIDDLKRVAGTLEPMLLKTEIEILVAEANLLQAEYFDLLDLPSWTFQSRDVNRLFKALTKIASTELRDPYQIQARGLYRDSEIDYHELLAEALEDRREHLAAREAELQRREEEVLERQRQEAEEAARNRTREASLTELKTFLRVPDEHDQHWVSELLERVTTHLLLGNADEELALALEPLAHLFDEGKAFQLLRKKFRKRSQSGKWIPAPAVEDEDDDEEIDESPSEHEGYRNAFNGKRGLIVGGDPREERCQELKSFFGFADLEWPATRESSSTVMARLKRRISMKKYDIVFYNVKFARHATAELKQYCQGAQVPFVYLPKGYGMGSFVEAVKQLQANGQLGQEGEGLGS